MALSVTELEFLVFCARLVQIQNCSKNKSHRREFFLVNALTTSVPHHKETSQLIFIASIATQLAGFYMMGNIGC